MRGPKLRAFDRFPSRLTILLSFGAVAVLAVAGVAAPAAPERENSGLRALWQEFPLDSERVDRDELAQRQPLKTPPPPPDEDAMWPAFLFLGIAALAALVLLAWVTFAFYRFAERRGASPAPGPAGEIVADAPATPARAQIHLVQPTAETAGDTAAGPKPPAPEPAAASTRREAPDVSEVLKEKLRANASFRKRSANDAHVLKEKLARAAEPAPAWAAASTGAAQGSVLTAKRPHSYEREARRLRECEITWSRSGQKSRFLAVSQQNGGGRSVVASSRRFRWRDSGPPPRTSAASVAFQVLVQSLKEDGWRVCGHGDRWYSVRLSREPDARRIANVQE